MFNFLLKITFTIADQNGFLQIDLPNILLKGPVTVGSSEAPTLDQLNQKPWGTAQVEILCKSSGYSNEEPDFKPTVREFLSPGRNHNHRLMGDKSREVKGTEKNHPIGRFSLYSRSYPQVVQGDFIFRYS